MNYEPLSLNHTQPFVFIICIHSSYLKLCGLCKYLGVCVTESLCGCVCAWFIKIYYLYVKRGEGKIGVKVIWTLKEDNFIKFNPCDTFLIDLQVWVFIKKFWP